MGDKDNTLDRDGIQDDGVSYYPADARRLQTYVDAERQLAHFHAPVFLHTDNPHERLYVACLDGTGNDETQPQLGPETNVAKIRDQILALDDPRIRPGYVPGPGTQDNWAARTWDGMTGGTYEERIETAYKQFIDQAKKWRAEDPRAEIRVVDLGFSRGAVEAAGLARLIQVRGIQDTSGAKYALTHDGLLVTHVEYTKPPLVAPGQVAQAELLFDPVGTGAPHDHDLRPPPSVISGLQITAEDERRRLFKSDHIIDPGQTPDGRFLGVTVAGAHSDIGGGYFRDGLTVRSENLAINYLNALSDKPFLHKPAEPDDPRLNVVHRSEEGAWYYRPFQVNRDKPSGHVERLVPQIIVGRDRQTDAPVYGERPGVHDPFNAEPRDERLNAAFTRQPVRTDLSPGTAAPSITKASSIDDMFDGLCAAAAKGDCADMRAIGNAYLESSQGQAWLGQGQQYNLEVQAQQAAALQAQMQSQQAAQQCRGFSL
ncbi:DUF2235 domain-containing protein [Dyella sp. A6]|uniref:DUF2235 domain-containing protein n=1 Tax=Dyella aluminiiresistens TaxID=3069105 RepID=UPI002E7A5827|nr:DUF2235 domain-containing protein [Dyella sp. A6]